MERPELSPETVAQLRVFLFAMERLPLVTPGVRMSLGLRLDQGGESDWIEIRMEDGEFTLGRGSWIDGDADTETVFEVGPGLPGWRCVPSEQFRPIVYQLRRGCLPRGRDRRFLRRTLQRLGS